MFSPFFDQDLGFARGIEDLSIEQFVPEPNYESPQDANTNNTYAFTVTATDVIGQFDPQYFFIIFYNTNDDPTGSVTISGTATEDQTLTASNTLADEDSLGTITYQWKRGGVDISGATNSTYTLTQDDVGAVITVTASYADDQGTTESAQSAATATVRYGDFKHAGSAGDDEMRGRYGDDILGGGDGEDSIIGGWGHDTLKGNTGFDSLRGWRGEDVLFGGTEDDFLYGGKGNDTLNGGGGEDLLFGRTGDDDLSGGRGQDTLKGGRGDDLLTSGFGADNFLFGRDNGNDTITDFNLGKDVIEIVRGARSLRQIDFAQAGDDVVMTFAATTVRVENITLAELNNADHFLFT